MYLQTEASLLKFTEVKVPSTMSLHIEAKSVLNKAKRFIASGSPKRALYSINFTPLAVTIKPP